MGAPTVQNCLVYSQITHPAAGGDAKVSWVLVPAAQPVYSLGLATNRAHYWRGPYLRGLWPAADGALLSGSLCGCVSGFWSRRNMEVAVSIRFQMLRVKIVCLQRCLVSWVTRPREPNLLQHPTIQSCLPAPSANSTLGYLPQTTKIWSWCRFNSHPTLC